MTARCARCPWSCRARDTGDAQDALVSHHNLAHGRRAERWTPYREPVLDEHEQGAPAWVREAYNDMVAREREERLLAARSTTFREALGNALAEFFAVLLAILTPGPRGYRPRDHPAVRLDVRSAPPRPPAGRGGGSR